MSEPDAASAGVPAVSHSGIVAVVGRPNVGKSSLVNALVGRKVSIVSNRPQTTRHRIQGVARHGAVQLVFVDTPGLHGREQRALNRQLNRTAASAIDGVEAVLQVVEAGRWREDDDIAQQRVTAACGEGGIPAVLAINKVDHVRDRARLLPELAGHSQRFAYADIVPVSATKGDNLERLKAVLAAYMPEGPALYPEGQVVGHDARFAAAEILREKATRILRDELPYAVSVSVEHLAEEHGRMSVHAVIWVEREAQKKIVIGGSGATLKAIGTAARRELMRHFDRPVTLQTHVRLRQNWSNDPAALRALGYED